MYDQFHNTIFKKVINTRASLKVMIDYLFEHCDEDH